MNEKSLWKMWGDEPAEEGKPPVASRTTAKEKPLPAPLRRARRAALVYKRTVMICGFAKPAAFFAWTTTSN